MKSYLKIFGLFIWIILLLVSGYYLVFNNLGTMLAGGKVDYRIERQGDRFLLKAGKWSETIHIALPVKVSFSSNTLYLKNDWRLFQVTFSPKIKIKTKKLPH